jgi:hypothetical protein
MPGTPDFELNCESHQVEAERLQHHHGCPASATVCGTRLQAQESTNFLGQRSPSPNLMKLDSQVVEW